MSPVTPAYWAEACAHLARKDRVMKKLIPQFGDAMLESRGDAFVTLARSIVGQQISVKAAQSVWDRFAKLSRKLTPAGVLKLKVDDMRAAGLSARKVEYLVLPLDDVGLINGISRSYFSGEPVSRSDAREVAQAWSPYCTVATWYIWRSLDPVPVAY